MKLTKLTKLSMVELREIFKQASKADLKVKLTETALSQDARSKRVHTYPGQITKVGKTCFYIGSKRMRPYFNLTSVRLYY